MPDSLTRRRSRAFIGGGVALATALLVGSGVAEAATRAVAISRFAFAPASITINVGDRVTWTNSDAVTHTATATSGAFDTGNIEQGQSASVRFTQPGTYRYICTPHPTMTGTIRVRASGAGPTDPPTDTVAPRTRAEENSGVAGTLLLASAVMLIGLAIARRRYWG
jgi:plastocyanin